MGTLSQDVVLEGQCACRKSQKGGKCERRHASYPKTTISDWENGLNPLKVGEDRVGDALDCVFEQSVEPLERWILIHSHPLKANNAADEEVLEHWKMLSKVSVHPARQWSSTFQRLSRDRHSAGSRCCQELGHETRCSQYYYWITEALQFLIQCRLTLWPQDNSLCFLISS